LIADAASAAQSGRLEQAIKILRRARDIHFRSDAARLVLARRAEEMGALEVAEDAYRELAAIGSTPDLKRLGREGADRVRDKRVVELLQMAADTTSSGQPGEALSDLEEAYRLSPPGPLQFRVCQSYYDVAARDASKSIRPTPEGEVVLGSSTEPDVLALRDALCCAARKGDSRAVVVGLPKDVCQAIADGTLRNLTAGQKRALRPLGAAGYVVTRTETHFKISRVRLLETEAVVEVCHRIRRLGPVPARPESGAWDLLVAKRRPVTGLRVEVWTDQAAYRIGSEIVFHVRATRPCFVTLIDLPTSGGMNVLLPNRFQKTAEVPAGQTVSIPAERAPFAIRVKGPPGVEGVKAIATLRPLRIGGPPHGQVFFHADGRRAQEELCKKIAEGLSQLGHEEWDVAEWTFRIHE